MSLTFMPGAALSPREAEILTLMADVGYTAKEVAQKLGTSNRTVETQIANAVTKLKARNKLHAVVLWDRARRTAGAPSVVDHERNRRRVVDQEQPYLTGNTPCEADCALCNGRGFYGTPGSSCSFCRGVGRVQWGSLPADGVKQ